MNTLLRRYKLSLISTDIILTKNEQTLVDIMFEYLADCGLENLDLFTDILFRAYYTKNLKCIFAYDNDINKNVYIDYDTVYEMKETLNVVESQLLNIIRERLTYFYDIEIYNIITTIF